MNPIDPIIRPPVTESEIRRQTDEILGDANDEIIKLYIVHIQNFMDADSENAYHLARTAQKHAFTKTLAFADAFSTFAGLPGGHSAVDEKRRTSEEFSGNENFTENSISEETH